MIYGEGKYKIHFVDRLTRLEKKTENSITQIAGKYLIFMKSEEAKNAILMDFPKKTAD